MLEQNLSFRIKNSFLKATKGEEVLRVTLWFWGGISYALAFLAAKLIEYTNFRFIDISIALLFIIYYIWHIIVIRKCAPKKPELSDEEKAKLKEERGKEFLKSFTRKLLLKEPITKFNAVTFVTVMNLYAITVFIGYLL